MLDGCRVDRRVFVAFRSADFAALREGEGGIGEEVEVEGVVML